jgi:putative ABC transport system permease protein
MLSDFFKLSIDGIRRKGIRSILTVAGIVIGIASVVMFISLSSGFQNAINKQFDILGANTIYVLPGSSFASTFGSTPLTDHDLEIIKRTHGVDLAGGMTVKISKISYRGEIKYTYVTGLMTDASQDILLGQTGIKISGTQKKFKPNDKYKVAVGYLFSEGKVFKRPVAVGDSIFINDQKFQVVGIVSKIGNSNDDSQLYIPMDTLNEVFKQKNNQFTEIMIRTKGGWATDQVAESIKKNIRRDRGQKEGNEDFTVMTLEQIQESVGSMLLAVQVIVVGIAAISIVVGGFNIMNSMYTSVLERTQEIGVMKAIGAKNSDILSLFLIESGTVGLVGGAIGCALGIGIAKGAELIAAQMLDEALIQASITPELVFGALAFSFLIGSASGVLPARQASQLNPVDALAYE